MFWKILKALGDFLKKMLGPAIAALVIGLFIKYVLPILIEKFTEAVVATWGFWILVIVLAVFFIAWILDKGKLGIGGCALQSHYLRPDKCVNVSCPKPCLAVTGPYPSWMGSYAFGTQDIACICPTVLTGGLGALPPHLQNLLNQALAISNEAELRQVILEVLMHEGIGSDKLDRLLELLQKLRRGEQLTPDEMDEIRKILTKQE